MAGEYALKDHLDFPTLTFILSSLHWEYALKDRNFCSFTALKAGSFKLSCLGLSLSMI